MGTRLNKRAIIWWTMMTVGLLLGAITWALAEVGARLFVVNALSADLSVIDIGSDRALGAIALGEHGYRVAFSPDGKYGYVTSSPGVANNTQAAQYAPSTALPRLLIIDLTRKKVSGAIPLEISPLANVHVRPDGRQAIVVTAGPQGARNAVRGRVLVVDLSQKKLLRAINIGLNPLDSVLTPDGRTLFTADWGSRALSVVDLAAGRLRDTIPLGAASRALAIAPDGKHVYAALDTSVAVLNGTPVYNANTTFFSRGFNSADVQTAAVAVIDARSGAIQRIPLDELQSILAIAVSPKGDRLYAYGPAMAAGLSHQNAAQNRDTPPTATQQMAQVSPRALADAYALCVIDLRKRAVTQRFGSFGYFPSLAVSPDGSKLYLIGTPGDPAREAVVQQRVASRLRDSTQNNSRGTLNGRGNMGKAGPAGPAGSAGPPDGWNVNTEQTANEIIDDVSQLPKTMIVLDAQTGRRLKTLPLGSLPQGYGVLAR